MYDNEEMIFLESIITGDVSGTIERSEKREQYDVVRNERLPIKTNDHSVPREVRYLGTPQGSSTEEIRESIRIEKENNIKWTK